MRKGVILEKSDGYLTMLTPEGEFLRARNTNRSYQIGEEIDFFPVEVEKRKRKWFVFPFAEDGKAFAAAALSLMLIMISFIPFYQSNKVYAYMSIDVNPSIELGFNDEYKVVKIIPYNDEGKLIVESLGKWKKEDVSDLTERIIAKIKENGFLNDNHEVVIATVVPNQAKKKNNKLDKELGEIKQSIQKEKLDLTVINATSKERDLAKENGVTAGIYKEKLKDNPNNIKNNNEDNQKGKNTAPGQLKKEENTTTNPENEKKQPPGLEKKERNSDSKKNNSSETSINKSNNNGNAKAFQSYKGKGNSERKNNGNGNQKQRGHFPYKYKGTDK